MRDDGKTKEQLIDELAELEESKTEWKQTEKELIQTKDYLNNLTESSLDSIMFTEKIGYITKVNKCFLELLGYREEEVVGKFVADLTPTNEDEPYESVTGELVKIDKEFLDNTQTMIDILLAKGKVSSWEVYYLRKDKKVVPVEQNIVCLYEKEGERIGAVSIIRDITDRRKVEKELERHRSHLEDVVKERTEKLTKINKQLQNEINDRKCIEKALKKSENKYQNLIEHANNAIISTNKEGIIISFNIRAEEMFGYSCEEILGKSILLLSPPRDRGREERVLEMLKKTKKIDVIETTREGKGLRKDGQEFPVEASVFSLEVQEEYIITSIIRNITERKKMEKQLIQSEKLRSLGELAGGVAHDFNNVLAAIIGRAQLLKMYIESPPGVEEKRKSVHEFKKGLDIIEKAAFDGAETIRRIQEFARKREDDKHFSIVDINELVNHALEFTHVKWKDEAESKGIIINIKKELAPLPLTRGSAAELREVFTNLINNAVDAMPQGGEIKIKTSKEDGYISIKVEDTGCGIPESIQNKIFDSFFTTKGVQSTGLGMSVSHGIISQHQGTITIDSIVDQGTTFTIKIPISEKADGKEENIENMPKDQRRARILIVEDEEEVRNVLSDILKHAGHAVEIATDGNQGVEMFRNIEFDLVVSDLGMPGMSGWQVAEKMKDINGRVPVAVITGWDMQLDESELKNKWIDFILKKPFEVAQILNLVQEGMVLRDRFKEA